MLNLLSTLFSIVMLFVSALFVYFDLKKKLTVKDRIIFIVLVLVYSLSIVVKWIL
ncbi:hypothetical protein UAW_00386 [Enterococcus haemoperoxidus ATCC BAA-382]|uniref:Uncharacterized protein n=1 Tax=Enterococcus haemoperoxidus ATCC BAA-382 TaxID=1158608 RepID=R2T4I4_9ENTE|nr:hypothetical protein UAW_00386 [Enterococcus haemoperoxidus ATCC BAA-382]EOT63023.1 hypothetical protein I583_02026 [Enterococcus haemoperoxidus ATCC BAA-382]